MYFRPRCHHCSRESELEVEHLSVESLLQYLEGEMTSADERESKAHLDACEDCRAKLADVRRMLQGMRAEDELVDPPQGLMGRLAAAFRRRLTRSDERSRREAHLQFDSWAQPAAAGVRGTSHERQLLFSESKWDLDLQIVREGEEDTFALRGQILGEEMDSGELEGIELRVTDSQGTERRGLTDHLGRFNFAQLSGGRYSVHVFLDEYDVVLDSVVLADTWADLANGGEMEVVD